MASSSHHTRQYVGLAIIIIAFIGGIIGWSWAALTVGPAETSAVPADSTQAMRGGTGMSDGIEREPERVVRMSPDARRPSRSA
jgi:hypothetical protein